MIALIDNYDSFTWNLVQFLGDLGEVCAVHRNDKITIEDVLHLKAEALILSPGPCRPDQAGICLELIAKASGIIPILGVCLGHEAIGQAFGGHIIRAPQPVHGKIAKIRHDESALFTDLEQDFDAARYHSLMIDETRLPDCLIGCAWSQDDLLMAVRHDKHCTFGVQFHPESIATQSGRLLLRNFLNIAKSHQSSHQDA